MKTAHEDRRVGKPQRVAQLLAQLGRRRRRERRDVPRPKLPQKRPDLEIRLPKLVPPTHDAVRLVHGHEPDLHRLDQVKEAWRAQPLRRNVEQFQLPRPQGPLDRAALLCALIAV